MHQSYRIADADLRIRTTSIEFAEWLSGALAPYREPDPDPGDHYHYSVLVADESGKDGRQRRRYNLLYRDSIALVRSLHLPTIGRALVEELESHHAWEADDGVHLRALPIHIGPSCVLVPWAFGGILSPLSSKLARRATILGSSDHVVVDPGTGLLMPLERRLDIDPESVRQLERMIPSEGGSSPRDRLSIEEATPVAAIVTQRPIGDRGLHPVGKAATVYRLANDALNLKRLGGRAVESLARLVERSNCYSIRAGNGRELFEDLTAGALSA